MSTLGEKLKYYRKSNDLTLDQLSKDLNKMDSNSKISKGRLSRWENDKDQPQLTSIKLLADYYNISLDYLMGISDSPKKKDVIDFQKVDTNSFQKVPLIGTIACGTPIFAEENIEDYVPIYFSENLKKENVFALRCKGNSMEPTLLNGDIVFIQKQPTVEDGEIAAVLIDGEATLKRVKHIDNKVLLIPDNTNGFQPIVLDQKNPGKILGKVIESRRQF